MCIFPGIALFRKYYKSIINCLPDNHFVTLSRLSELVAVDDLFFNQVLKCTNSKRGNRKILDAIIMQLKGDYEMASYFCKRLRDLLGNKPLTGEILAFQIGMMGAVFVVILIHRAAQCYDIYRYCDIAS